MKRTNAYVETVCRSFFSHYVTKWEDMPESQREIHRADMRQAIEAADKDSDNG